MLQTKDGETPVIFSDSMYHDQVEEALVHEGIIAAGFVKMEGGKLTCYGKSESLNIDSRGADDEIIIGLSIHPNV